MSDFIVKEANRLLEPVSEKCVGLTLNETTSAFEQKMDIVMRNTNIESKTKQFLTTVRVRPSGALLEATVNYDIKEDKMSLIGDISRINLYGNQSLCIENAFLRKYCFCK